MASNLIYGVSLRAGSAGFNNRYEVGHNNVDVMSHTQKNNVGGNNFNNGAGGGGGKCFKCGDEGHKKADCPNPIVVVSNLEESVTNEDLSELFGNIGNVRKVSMKGKGLAEIVFVKKEDAEKAVVKYDHRILDGRAMNCSMASSGSGGGGKKFGCFKCGEEGHKQAACLKGVAGGRVQKPGRGKSFFP